MPWLGTIKFGLADFPRSAKTLCGNTPFQLTFVEYGLRFELVSILLQALLH